jgi:hypothetical protein
MIDSKFKSHVTCDLSINLGRRINYPLIVHSKHPYYQQKHWFM